MTIARTATTALLVASTATLGALMLAGPASADDSTEIGPVYQAVGAPDTGTCSAFADTTLDWGGVSSGGWTDGWGAWLNDGSGGAACVRTLTFDPTTQTWSVAE